MKGKLIAWMNSRRYNSHLMRLLVGGYVAYLGGKIMKNQAQAGSFDPILSICAVFLILFGLPVALISLYAVYHGYSVEYKGNTNMRKRNRLEEPEADTDAESPSEK